MKSWKEKANDVGNALMWIFIFYLVGILAFIVGMIRGGEW